MDWNPKDPPRYGGLKIDGVPPFKTAIEFEFDPEVNVFIGPNATGKSTLLKLLSPEYQEFGKLPDAGVYSIERAGDNWLDPRLGDNRVRRVPSETPPPPGQTKVNRGTVPVVYLPPVREVAPPYPEEFAEDDSRPENRYERFYVYRLDKPIDDRESGLPNYDDETSAAMSGWYRLVELAEEKFNPRDFRIQWSTREKPWKWDALPRRVRERMSGANKELWLDAYPFTTFDANRVYYALQKLADDETRTGSGRAAAAVAGTTRACLRDICPEVIQGDLASYPVDVPLDLDADEYEIGYTKVMGNFGMATETRDSESPLYWGDLSTGTQGLFWWICYLALKVGEHYSFSDGADAEGRSLRWWHQPAILLIDEIENHLHPTWQRRVIPALRKHFPGLQIFATTHSPFVVAGLKRGQVHRLYREKGVIKTDQLTEEEKERKLVGWTVEEILREFMDVTDPTDEETAMAAAALRWLRGRQPPQDPKVNASSWVQECIQDLQRNHERLLGEEQALRWLSENQPGGQSELTAEKWWLATIERLRSAIGPDLEAGGPIAAQTDRFLEEIERIAREYGIKEEPDEEVG